MSFRSSLDASFFVESRLTFSPFSASFFCSKSVELLTTFGGIDALLAGLGTDPRKGLDSNALTASAAGGSDPTKATSADRQRVYGANTLPVRPAKGLFYLMWLALQDKVLVSRRYLFLCDRSSSDAFLLVRSCSQIILCIAAVVSLALGLYQTFGADPEIVDGKAVPSVDWVEGVAIMVAVAIVVLVGATNDVRADFFPFTSYLRS